MSSNRQNNVSNIFITVTTLIFAITSLITVYISLSAWKEEREAVRPYLTFQSSPQVYFNAANQLVFSFKFTNVGLHPASSLHCQTVIVNCSLDDKPLHTDQHSLVNNIPQNSPTDLIIVMDSSSKGIDKKNITSHYIIINLKYTDPILEKDHEQILYLRWGGISNGKINLIFHASRDDKNNLVNYLAKL